MTCQRLEQEGMLAELGGQLESHVAECADCQARLVGYQTLASWIAAAKSARRAPAGFAQRTMARARAEGARRRRRRWAAGTLVAAAAAIALYLVTRPAAPSEPARLALQVEQAGGWRSAPAMANVGDVIRAEAKRGDAPIFELRVYRNARALVQRCPATGDASCRGARGELLQWRIPSVGTYQVLLLVSERPIPAPRGTLDQDVHAATGDGARVVEVKALYVR